MDRLWTPWRYAYITGGSTGDKSHSRRGVPEELEGWPGDCQCVFCNMIAAAAWAVEHGMDPVAADRSIGVVERAETCFIVLNGFPYNNGHLMVVPFEHQASLAVLPEHAAIELMRLARRAEQALRAVYRPDGLNMGLNLGESAGAGVAHHLHLHAVPRWSGDTNFMTVTGETRILPEMLADSWTRLSKAFAELG